MEKTPFGGITKPSGHCRSGAFTNIPFGRIRTVARVDRAALGGGEILRGHFRRNSQHEVVVGKKREERRFHAVGTIREIGKHADIVRPADVLHPRVFLRNSSTPPVSRHRTRVVDQTRNAGRSEPICSLSHAAGVLAGGRWERPL